MPVPATTGQLRTRVQDMEIGDYIACNYSNPNSGAIGNGAFSGLGGTVEVEIPVAGSATPNGTFYFVKIAKGLLFSDRVLQHTIAWDAINGNKWIQGKPWDAGNIIPAMTSNTSPSGVASASSILNETYDAWKAFDKVAPNTNNGWITASGVLSGWLAYEFPFLKIIKAYSILGSSGATGKLNNPKSWTFEGWTGTEWVVLDRQSSITSWSSGVKKTFLILANTHGYQKYRINVSESCGTSYVCIEELEMAETAGIIRSLTGGVAYADAQGNKATTDQGFGGWPTNNEWDRFIVNFPHDKIQADKTYYDVFNSMQMVSGSNYQYTWTQDTPMIAMTVNTNKVIRRNHPTVPRQLNYVASSTVGDYAGFRPVFEYRE